MKPQDCHLIIDMRSPSFSDVNGLAATIRNATNMLAAEGDWRSISVTGTAFPESLTVVKAPGGMISREEWIFYKQLRKISRSGDYMPNFGDYGIAHPVAVGGDMRFWTPSASIRYTSEDAWYILKGTRVRPNGREKNDGKTQVGGYAQFRDICAQLVDAEGLFAGPLYSAGDRYIEGCSKGLEKTGNLTTWRWVGNNHHITKVVKDLHAMKFFA